MERRSFTDEQIRIRLFSCGNSCECTGCGHCGAGSRCLMSFQSVDPEADHIGARNDNSSANLALLCPGCHRAKTSVAASLSYLCFGTQTAETIGAINRATAQSKPSPREQIRNLPKVGMLGPPRPTASSSFGAPDSAEPPSLMRALAPLLSPPTPFSNALRALADTRSDQCRNSFIGAPLPDQCRDAFVGEKKPLSYILAMGRALGLDAD
jgi:hypothetical protein